MEDLKGRWWVRFEELLWCKNQCISWQSQSLNNCYGKREINWNWHWYWYDLCKLCVFFNFHKFALDSFTFTTRIAWNSTKPTRCRFDNTHKFQIVNYCWTRRKTNIHTNKARIIVIICRHWAIANSPLYKYIHWIQMSLR